MNRTAFLKAAGFSLALLVGTSSARSLPRATLWVVQPPHDLVAFEPSNMSRVGGVRLPERGWEHPQDLRVNARGQILLSLDDRWLWRWDGIHAGVLDGDSLLTASGCRFAADSSQERIWFLGGDGTSLFAYQRALAMAGVSDPDSADTRVRVDRVDLSGVGSQCIVQSLFPRCEEGMRLIALVQPCEVPAVYSAGGVISDYFILSHWYVWIPGVYEGKDLVSTPVADLRTELFSEIGGSWEHREIRRVWEPLSLSVRRPLWIELNHTPGCCGWVNNWSDGVGSCSPDTCVQFFDEWSEFANGEFNLRFFPSSAEISPDEANVALEMTSTHSGENRLRPAYDRHPDSLQTAAALRTLGDLPRVEVHPSRILSQPTIVVPHAQLVGWADSQHVLVVQEAELVSYDLRNARPHRTGVMVRSPRDARMVWR